MEFQNFIYYGVGRSKESQDSFTADKLRIDSRGSDA